MGIARLTYSREVIETLLGLPDNSFISSITFTPYNSLVDIYLYTKEVEEGMIKDAMLLFDQTVVESDNDIVDYKISSKLIILDKE